MEGIEYSFMEGFFGPPFFFLDRNTAQQKLILQAGKDAEKAEVNNFAQTDSYRILAKCAIDPNKVDAEKTNLDLEEAFRVNT